MSAFTVIDGSVTRIGIWAGDVIVFKDRRYKVTKVNPKNYVCLDENGGKWNVRIHPSVVRAEDQTWDGPKEKNEWELYQEANQVGIKLGTPVQFVRAGDARKFPGTYICAAKNSSNWRFVRLNGDDDRYVNVPVGSVTSSVKAVTL